MVAIASLCVFCGSSTPPDRRTVMPPGRSGPSLRARGIGLVYGGGRVGLMGGSRRWARPPAAGSSASYLIGLFGREIAHTELTELHEVRTHA